MSVSRDALLARIADVNALMRAHAGGIELQEVSAAGVVSVRFAGKCTGCELRPLTMAGTVRPSLMAVNGVTEVVAAGCQISEEAARRVAAALGDDAAQSRWLNRMYERRLNLQATES